MHHLKKAVCCRDNEIFGLKHLVHSIAMQRERSGQRSIAHNSLVVIEKKTRI